MVKETFREKVASRKFMLMLGIFLGSISLMMMPGLLEVFTGVKIATLLTGGEYSTIILGSYSVYFGANVFQKKLANDGEQNRNNEEQ
jgi:hypothetical protein